MTSYDFYINVYLGNVIAREDVEEYLARASEQLGRYKRIYTVTVPEDLPDGEDRAVCAMAEALYSFDQIANGESGPVQSASIGSVSVSYGNRSVQAVDISPKGQAMELYRCACLYLDIYRGVG